MKKVLTTLVILLILGLGGYYMYSQFTYSEGNRPGVLIKFSKKGYIFKTYEGEINQIGMNAGLANNLWDFSVKDPAVADALEKKVGKNVSLHYRQINRSFAWQGDTNYFVDSVSEVK